MLYTEPAVTFEVDDIDPQVAKYCAAKGLEIAIEVRGETESRHSGYTYRLHITADVYTEDEEDNPEWQELQESGCDAECRYDGDYNWDYCEPSRHKAEAFLQAYVAHQRSLYPNCHISAFFDGRLAQR